MLIGALKKLPSGHWSGLTIFDDVASAEAWLEGHDGETKLVQLAEVKDVLAPPASPAPATAAKAAAPKPPAR